MRFDPDSDETRLDFRYFNGFYFSMRTELHTGMLFFAHAGEGMYVYGGLEDSVLRFEFSNGIYSSRVSFDPPGVSFCNGSWFHIAMEKDGQKATITVKDVGSVSEVTIATDI